MKKKSKRGEKREKTGRPTLFTEIIGKKIIQLVSQGRTQKEIAEIMGVSEQNISDWKKSQKPFSYDFKLAEEAANDVIEARLWQRAAGYSHPEDKFFCYEGQIIRERTIRHHPPDTKAAIYWLNNRRPQRWREKISIVTDESTPIEIESPDGKVIDKI